MGPDYTPILTSALNAESSMKFLNIWRPILQSMMFIHCRRNSLNPSKVIRRLLKNGHEDKHDLIVELFNLPELRLNKGKALSNVDDPIFFVKREKYSEEIVEGVLDFMIEFIREVLGERDDYYSEMD